MTTLLDRIIEQYLGSSDFNGYFFHSEPVESQEQAIDLIRARMVEVVGEIDYPNPHIRPWPTRRPIEEQVKDIAASDGEYGAVCLYPTAGALTDRLDPQLYLDQPYRRRLAEGRGTLELAYFRFDVLEVYRNDPRFSFDFHDFGARAVIGDEAYLDQEEPEEDKTSISHIGFAYDLSAYDPEDPTTPITRRVCAFLGDLSDLTAIHQQRWRTYEVPEQGLEPHPVWFAMEMGHWPDGLGPFDRLLFELRSWDELHRIAFGTNLLRTTDRPREFGWILRPSQQEFEAFILQLDKLISDNLRHEAFDKADVPRKDKDGNQLGTLNRLDYLLAAKGISDGARRGVLKPLREVRAARQRPAHALRSNVNDRTFIRKQAELLDTLGESVNALREFWQRHPATTGWSPPKHVRDGKLYRL